MLSNNVEKQIRRLAGTDSGVRAQAASSFIRLSPESSSVCVSLMISFPPTEGMATSLPLSAVPVTIAKRIATTADTITTLEEGPAPRWLLRATLFMLSARIIIGEESILAPSTMIVPPGQQCISRRAERHDCTYRVPGWSTSIIAFYQTKPRK